MLSKVPAVTLNPYCFRDFTQLFSEFGEREELHIHKKNDVHWHELQVNLKVTQMGQIIFPSRSLEVH